MSDGAERVAHTDLGVDSCGVGATVSLYEDGDVAIQNGHDAGLVLEREQVQALVVFLIGQEALEP